LPNRERDTESIRQPRSPAAGALTVRSPLQAIVLGLVIQRPSYGYEIADRCQRLCGSFLHVHQTSIYGALERLNNVGLIEALDRRPRLTGHRERRYFRVTTEGGRQHQHWAESEIRPETERAQLLARIATAGRSGTKGLRLALDRYERVLANQAENLAENQVVDASYPSLDALCERLVIVERRIALAGSEEWLAVARDEVNDFEVRRAKHQT
jgi:DNA-binding PadR family transcriptional regulator